MIIKLQFIADYPNAGHTLGDIIEVDNEASRQRWLRRNCVKELGASEEQPKRKRRTKAEMEAARAAEPAHTDD